jgi:hypothetical protein
VSEHYKERAQQELVGDRIEILTECGSLLELPVKRPIERIG